MLNQSIVKTATFTKKEMSLPQNILEIFLKEHEEDHFDFTPQIDYKVSTGSLKLDFAMGGGLGPGFHRFLGASEGGKSSSALTVARNFLKTVPNSRVLIIKAEGRLSQKVMKRSKVKFASSAADWKEGTAYIFKCNIYETVAQLIDGLIKNNDGDYKYLFIIDCVDGLILREDLAKEIGGKDHVKVAGPNVLSKLLLKRTSLAMSELGHMGIMISQVIATISNQYERKDQIDIGGSGGNALIHFSNWILCFLPRFKKHLITKDGKPVIEDFDTSNIVGHNCRIRLSKSENEQSNKVVEYPVRYGAGEEDSIWTEMEIEDFLISWQLVEKRSSWYTISETARKLMVDNGIKSNIPEKIQGGETFIKFLSTPEIRDFWVGHFRRMINDDIF